MKLLEGKVAIITGASRGIGKGIAEVFADQGATIAFTYASSDEKARAFEAELAAKGVKAKGYKSDASDFNAAQTLVDEVVAEFGTVDILVNNAGITRDTLLMRMSEEQWDEVLRVNLKSVFNLTKAVIKPMLKARCGSIINMTSIVGVTGNAGQANYAASKAGMIGFTKSVAQELGSRNIRCNAIAPGWIMTERQKTLWLTPEGEQELMIRQCLKRKLVPADIAKVTVFMASSEAEAMTNQQYVVDGGWV